MRRLELAARPHWKSQAESLGFAFHTIDGEPYWIDDACYAFSLAQIETDIEDVSTELHAMAMDFAAEAVRSESVLQALRIPPAYWELIARSYARGDRHLYGRMDLAYSGDGPAKLIELNYDTPTSLYEAAYFQWIWLEEQIGLGALPKGADQYNAIQDILLTAFTGLKGEIDEPLVFASVRDHLEDRGTVLYLKDIAAQAGLKTAVIDLEDIGLSADRQFTDLDHQVIRSLFKLYPLEFMFADPYGAQLPQASVRLFEPPWKAVLSNKGVLAELWKRHPNHPNLLPAFYVDKPGAPEPGWVIKPLLSREGANIALCTDDGIRASEPGPYDDGGFVRQAYQVLPRFGAFHAVLGAWVIADRAAGMGIREDRGLITRDSSRFVPHVIL